MRRSPSILHVVASASRILRAARVALFAAGFAATLPALGCGGAALRAAEHGNHAELRAEIAPKHARGKLSLSEASDLAHAVAEREITTAKDEPTALVRLHETRGCARELDDALETRMRTRDGAGAEAALSRLEDGKLSDGDARDWLDDPDDRWRAVATRTLHRSADRKKRQAAILDPSPRIRRSAIRAAADAHDGADLDLLFETARIDPDLLLRNEALRSTSAIVRELGTTARARAAELAVKLRDLWTAGDDALKEDIAVAWALEPVYANGGREALRVTLADGAGPGAIAAAGAVLRSSRKDAELGTSARGLLARTIGEGSRRDRLHAVVVAAPEGPMLDALRKAAAEEDREIAIAALARLLESEADRDHAKSELLAIAGQDAATGASTNGARLETNAVRARHVLAAAGELRVQAWIERDLASTDVQRKTSAAGSLAALGRAGRAAPLLADPDPTIRTRVACTILTAARH